MFYTLSIDVLLNGVSTRNKHIDEVVVIASRTVNKPDGYINQSQRNEHC